MVSIHSAKNASLHGSISPTSTPAQNVVNSSSPRTNRPKRLLLKTWSARQNYFVNTLKTSSEPTSGSIDPQLELSGIFGPSARQTQLCGLLSKSQTARHTCSVNRSMSPSEPTSDSGIPQIGHMWIDGTAFTRKLIDRRSCSSRPRPRGTLPPRTG